MPPKNTKIARSRALQDVTNVESEGANERATKKQVITLEINTQRITAVLLIRESPFQRMLLL